MSKSLKRLTDDEARTFLEGVRWPDGPVCPHCQSKEVTALNGKSCRKGLKKCRTCRKQFTVTVGTIFERSHIPLNDWIFAFDSMCVSKKGISALQLSRELGCQYKTAWFMCHRIRESMTNKTLVLGKPGGFVEADETFVGGKTQMNRKMSNKTPVLALVERDGNVKTRVLANINAIRIRAEIWRSVDREGVTFCSDQAPYFARIGKEFPLHLSVNHSVGEYARPDGAGINSCESFFALIKRGVYGTFHNVSRKHLHRYCTEFEFRWNHRKVNDGERVVALLGQVEGKRLTYRAAGEYTRNPQR